MGNTSAKHLLSQERLRKLFSYSFERVFKEFYLPVPNPEIIIGDHSRRSLRGYLLDVFAEGPILYKFKQLKYTKIGIEVDCFKGHDSTRQTKRDNHRSEYVGEFMGVHIIRFSCHSLIGKAYRDPFNKWKPRSILSDAEILLEAGIVLFSYEELKAQKII